MRITNGRPFPPDDELIDILAIALAYARQKGAGLYTDKEDLVINAVIKVVCGNRKSGESFLHAVLRAVRSDISHARTRVRKEFGVERLDDIPRDSPAANFAQQQAHAIISKLRVRCVAADDTEAVAYLETMEELINEGLKPTPALVAERMEISRKRAYQIRRRIAERGRPLLREFEGDLPADESDE